MDISAILDHMGSERVAERVDRCIETEPLRCLMEALMGGLSRDASSSAIQEERILTNIRDKTWPD